ncbi:unnamed protein product [Trichogramma brassicae]|uniref:Uncharacterized protein n=1 Tax=Trichogramma brassicae TaxID=86971 RepID=A0A6H5HWV6_9HYME|nr:unnamed protein product [Trichogramma brassicae]
MYPTMINHIKKKSLVPKIDWSSRFLLRLFHYLENNFGLITVIKILAKSGAGHLGAQKDESRSKVPPRPLSAEKAVCSPPYYSRSMELEAACTSTLGRTQTRHPSAMPSDSRIQSSLTRTNTMSVTKTDLYPSTIVVIASVNRRQQQQLDQPAPGKLPKPRPAQHRGSPSTRRNRYQGEGCIYICQHPVEPHQGKPDVAANSREQRPKH